MIRVGDLQGSYTAFDPKTGEHKSLGTSASVVKMDHSISPDGKWMLSADLRRNLGLPVGASLFPTGQDAQDASY